MRLFVLLFLCSAALTASAANVSTVRVWPEYRPAESFERVGEFITGREVTGRETLLRTQPDQRGGFYFLTRIRNKDSALENVRVELKVITPDSVQEKTFNTFAPVTLRKGSQVIHVGLTGTDWQSEEIHPVAWQLRFLDSAGNELTRDASFLWGKPR